MTRRAAVPQRCERLGHLCHFHRSPPLRLLLLSLDLAQQQLALLLAVRRGRIALRHRLPPCVKRRTGCLDGCQRLADLLRPCLKGGRGGRDSSSAHSHRYRLLRLGVGRLGAERFWQLGGRQRRLPMLLAGHTVAVAIAAVAIAVGGGTCKQE